MKSRQIETILILTAVGIILSGPAMAQQGVDMARQLGEDYRALKEFSWSMRTEVRLKDQQQSVTMDMMRYDLDGKLQSTPMGGSGSLSPELQSLADELVRMGFNYAQPKPSQAEKFMQGASVWTGRRGNEGTTRADGEDVLVPGDSVDLRAVSQRPERMTAETFYRSSKVKIRADYRSFPNNGPNYVARLDVVMPDHSLDVIVENFDYQASEGIAAGDISILQPGTALIVRLEEPLDSSKNTKGHEFQAETGEDLVVNNRTVFPKGSKVTGEIVNVEGSGKTSGRAKMSLTLIKVEVNSKSVDIVTNTLNFEAEDTHKKDRRRILGGAGVGALIGGIAGGGSGLAKGALVGGGIGTAATLLTKGDEVKFDIEHKFTFQLTKKLQIAPN